MCCSDAALANNNHKVFSDAMVYTHCSNTSFKIWMQVWILVVETLTFNRSNFLVRLSCTANTGRYFARSGDRIGRCTCATRVSSRRSTVTRDATRYVRPSIPGCSTSRPPHAIRDSSRRQFLLKFSTIK